MPRMTRRQRRQLATPAGQAVAVHPMLDDAIARHPSSQARRHISRGGLVRRAKAYLARRYVDKLGPAIVGPLVAGAVVLVAVGVLVGIALGIALAAGTDRPGEWSE